MGVLWTVWPLDQQMTDWLSSQNITFPKTASRFPTGREIREVLSAFPAVVKIVENGTGAPFSATVYEGEGADERWTLLQITDYTGDDEPQALWFEKGHETLVKDVMSRLAVSCGPLVLIADVGDPPEVILAA
jgi:hypothetical protein